MKKFKLVKIVFVFVLFFVFTFSFSNSVYALNEPITYTVSCVNYSPITISSDGNIISGLEQIPEIYKLAFADKLKEYVRQWETMSAEQQQGSLSFIAQYYGFTCTIKNNEANTEVSAQSLFTPVKTPPIVFTPEVGFPGFSGPITVDGYLFGKFIFALFTYSIYLSGVLAVIFVSIAGFKWVSAGGNQSKITEAKNQLINSITGMFLVFATFLILSTINEDLVIMKEIKTELIDPVDLEDGDMIEVGGWGTEGCPDRGVDSGASCRGVDIEKAARELLGKTSGPCHCACFVSGVLKKAGCGNTIHTNTTQLKNELLTAWGSSTNKGYNPKLGDVIYTKEHIVISLAGDNIIHSGGIDAGSDCKKDSLSCSNSWHGLFGNKRLWTYGSCKSNQVIKKGTNTFLKGSGFTNYTVLIKPVKPSN